MTQGKSSTNSLKQRCSVALAAFGLSIGEQVDPPSSGAVDLLVLKEDQESTLFRVRCLEDGVSELFVVKYRSAQDKLVSFALTAKVEKLLASEHSLLAWTDAHGAQPLIPRRKRISSGQAFLLDDQLHPLHKGDEPGKGYVPKGCWSVSEYLANAPAFDWLEAVPTWSPAHARAAGELLAKLHCAGRLAKEKLTGAEKHQLSSLLASLPRLLKAALEAGQCKGLASKKEAEETEETQATQATTDALSHAIAALTTGPSASVLADEELIVHGDFHPGNVLFAGTTALAVIDLDYAHVEHPLYDLAYALLMFAPTADTADRATSLLEGYCDHYNQSAQQPPSFLPTASELASDLAALRQEESRGTSPFQQYVVVAASLILLWTLSEEGSKHPSAKLLAKRMVSHIN